MKDILLSRDYFGYFIGRRPFLDILLSRDNKKVQFLSKFLSCTKLSVKHILDTIKLLLMILYIRLLRSIM